MSTHNRKVTGLVTRALAAAAMATAPLLLVNACSDGAEQKQVVTVGESGRLQLNLAGTSNTDQVYQLRDGTFTISGLSTGVSLQVSTEANPSSTSLIVELPADTYEVFLEAGWSLQRVTGGAAIQAQSGAAIRPRASSPRKLSRGPVGERLDVDAGAPAPPPPVPPPGEGPPASSVVAATLVSPNPAITSLQPNVVSPVDFVFQVGDETVETGNGLLEIGISVIEEAAACSPDAFEPNDDLAAAAAITAGVQISASLCDLDIDNYLFPAPVAAGEAFSVVVGFQTALGDIDAVLLEAETGLVVSIGAGVVDDETLFAVSNGGDYILQTYLFFDPDGGGNTYTVDVLDEFSTDAENACCEASDLPGCDDPEVLACVCAVDSFCCQVAFDPVCVSLALECGTTCSNEGAESDCCTTSDAPGCTDQAVHDCVCATDFSCCASNFDEVCAAQAIAECGAQCPLPPPESDCCSASSTPGCTLPGVQACVCEIDPVCCSSGFDESCAALADAQCGAECLF